MEDYNDLSDRCQDNFGFDQIFSDMFGHHHSNCRGIFTDDPVKFLLHFGTWEVSHTL